MSLRNVLGLLGRPWAITPEGFETVCAIIDRRAAGIKFTDAEIVELIKDSRAEFEERHGVSADSAGFMVGGKQGGTVAVISIYGTILPRPVLDISGGGGASLTQFMSYLAAADSDPSVKAIVLDIDSPGGSVFMLAEAAAAIAGASKPVVAVANTMAGSAAYYLASQADEIVASPSALVGSIGTLARHVDESRALEMEGLKVTLVSAGANKTDGNPYEPLSESALSTMLEMVNEYYDQFVNAVAVGRGIAPEEVIANYSGGKMYTAERALSAGMVDRIETLDATIARLLAAAAPTHRNTFARADSDFATAIAQHAAERELSAVDLAESLVYLEETSPETAETASGADKPAPVHPRIARVLNRRS